MKKFKTLASSALALALPMMVLAATVETALDKAKGILNLVIGILFILVTLWFVWGVIEYVKASGKEEEIKKGKDHMIWGIIGMAVMAGAWGLASVLLQTFDVSSTGIPTGPGTAF